MTKTKCTIPKCRNVGRMEYTLVTEAGDPFCEVEGIIPICKKHLIEAINEMADRFKEEDERANRDSQAG